MFEKLKKLFMEERRESSPEEVAQQTHVAACVLLLEAAHADHDCTAKEMRQVLETLASRHSIPEEYQEELLALAGTEREKAVDLWQFTNHLNQHQSVEERLSIMEDAWRIIHADGVLERHEDHFAHKLASLLRLTHQQLIDAKMKARGSL